MTVLRERLRRRLLRRRPAPGRRLRAVHRRRSSSAACSTLANRRGREPRAAAPQAAGAGPGAGHRPRVLLLDEIGGGLTDAEAVELVDDHPQLRQQGIAIVWIEHIVHVLVQVVDRLVCMEPGRVIADGEPDAVSRDAVVIDGVPGQGGACQRRLARAGMSRC